jgi:membrane protein
LFPSSDDPRFDGRRRGYASLDADPRPSPVNVVQRLLGRFDRFQQSRSWVAFPLAVAKKFGDDRAGSLAALIAYYAFFSVFPLLLVLVSVLGILLRGDPGLQERILDTALAQFPVIGEQLRRPASVAGNGMTLAIGTVTALWAGLGVTQAAQNAMNEVWDVPIKERPNFLWTRVRGLLMLVVLGAFVLSSTFLSGLITAEGALSVLLRIGGLLASLALNLALFLVTYRILTRADLSWGDVFPGAGVAAVLWTVMQGIGGYYVTHQVKNATSVYGTFALVIGLLAWFYVGAQLTLCCAEINVVRVRHLWPRSLVTPPMNEADERTLRAAAKIEERVPEEVVDVTFDRSGDERPAERG